MNREIVEIIKPGVYTNLNSYWAMHFCSILETLYEQNTIQHGFQRNYMENIEPTLENLVTKAGFAFFQLIQNSLQNFGFQILLRHYLCSSEGHPIVSDIISKVSDLHKYDFLSETNEYGVFISCKDFESGRRFAEKYSPILLGSNPNPNNLHLQEISDKISYADLCILLKGDGCNYGVLGEVEGNHSAKLCRNSFWERKAGEYYFFGIGVRQRACNYSRAPGGQVNPSSMTGGWVSTNCGYKYIIEIESDNSVVKDFYDAIGTVCTLMTLGPKHRATYDSSLLPVLNLIKQGWSDNIVDLIKKLRHLLVQSDYATLGTNPLPIKRVPSIIT